MLIHDLQPEVATNFQSNLSLFPGEPKNHESLQEKNLTCQRLASDCLELDHTEGSGHVPLDINQFPMDLWIRPISGDFYHFLENITGWWFESL